MITALYNSAAANLLPSNDAAESVEAREGTAGPSAGEAPHSSGALKPFATLFQLARHAPGHTRTPNGGAVHNGSGKTGGPQSDAKKDVQGAEGVEAHDSCPMPASGVYDVATTDDCVIKQLENSKSPQTRRLGFTIEHAKSSYGDLLALNPPARIIVMRSGGNGGEPVMAITGPQFNRDGDAHVYTHYHGDNATVADPLGSKSGMNARIRAVINGEDKQAVFVLPESANAPPRVDAPGKSLDYSASWNHVKSQSRTTHEALAAMGVKSVTDRIVSAHSGGGMALVNAIEGDRSGKGIEADRLELYDCVYHFRTSDPKHPVISERFLRDWGKTANGQACGQVIYYRGTNATDDGRADTIREGFGGAGRFTFVDVANVPEPATRTYKHDSHYRTVGQFLGSTPSTTP